MNPFKKILILLCILIVLIFSFNYFFKEKQPEYYTEAYVIRVIDGDTFIIDTNQSVRLICIDTPELGEPGSYEAKAFLESLILNKTVKLEKDISEIDKYNRLLRYVYVDNIFVNKKIVQQGYGEIFQYEPDTKRCDEIKK